MRFTSKATSPVITLLASNPQTSRRFRNLLESLLHMTPISVNTGSETSPTGSAGTCNTHESDGLDQIFPTAVPSLRRRFDSTALRCPLSGTVLHILSVTKVPDANCAFDGTKNDDDEANDASLSLLSITSSCSMDKATSSTSEAWQPATDAVKDSRRLLTSHMKQVWGSGLISALALKLAVADAAGWPIASSHILGRDNGLPLLDLPGPPKISGVQNAHHSPNGTDSGSRNEMAFSLREVVLPYFDEAKYSDGSSLLSRFSASGLGRPLVGLFQWPSPVTGVSFRPLPAAKEDMALPPPSLVFQCPCLDNVDSPIKNAGFSLSKVGYSGDGENGQLMVRHMGFSGLDIRLCDSTRLSSSFAEAQEALLAGSLSDLQNSNVMAEGGDSRSRESKSQRSDSMNGLGDCWIEFRANMKRPSGFLRGAKTIRVAQKSTDKERVRRIARAPDLPYE